MKDIEERNKEWKTTRKKGRKEWRERDKESKLTLAPERLFSLVFLRLATVGHSYILPGRSFSLDLSGFLGTKISEISESFPFTIKKVALNICRLTSWGMLCNSLHPVSSINAFNISCSIGYAVLWQSLCLCLHFKVNSFCLVIGSFVFYNMSCFLNGNFAE